MSEGVLTVLKFCLLALVYLFLARVVWVVGLELRGTPAVASAPPEPAPSRGSRRRQFHLSIVEPENERGTYPIDGEVTIGRAGGCNIALAGDTFVSQVHARVFERGGDVYVEDLGSTNGTLLNGAPLTAVTRLQRGDRLQIGQTFM